MLGLQGRTEGYVSDASCKSSDLAQKSCTTTQPDLPMLTSPARISTNPTTDVAFGSAAGSPPKPHTASPPQTAHHRQTLQASPQSVWHSNFSLQLAPTAAYSAVGLTPATGAVVARAVSKPRISCTLGGGLLLLPPLTKAAAYARSASLSRPLRCCNRSDGSRLLKATIDSLSSTSSIMTFICCCRWQGAQLGEQWRRKQLQCMTHCIDSCGWHNPA